MQTQLEKDYSQTFTGQSVSSTVYKLITINQGSRASKVKSDFKMPDKRFWWIKLRALVEIRDWDGVATLAKSKKSPIGYEPFVEECVKAGQFTEASKYIQRCDPHLRAGLFLKIESYAEAGEEAFQQKDMETLQYVYERDRCVLPEPPFCVANMVLHHLQPRFVESSGESVPTWRSKARLTAISLR